jgi:hypothetical protein
MPQFDYILIFFLCTEYISRERGFEVSNYNSRFIYFSLSFYQVCLMYFDPLFVLENWYLYNYVISFFTPDYFLKFALSEINIATSKPKLPFMRGSMVFLTLSLYFLKITFIYLCVWIYVFIHPVFCNKKGGLLTHRSVLAT